MTREEAINEIKSWSIPSKKGREVLKTLIPELRGCVPEQEESASKINTDNVLWNSLHDVLALGFIHYLDENRQEGKMCLSNTECQNIMDAFRNKNWERIYLYQKKYLFHKNNMETTTTYKKTFGDVMNINAIDGTFRFSIYRYDDDANTVYLSNVFVKEKSRGKGYGNAILNIVDDVAKEMGATTICLTVKGGSFAHQWYERHGYEYLSDNDDEEFVGHIWMKKQL